MLVKLLNIKVSIFLMNNHLVVTIKDVLSMIGINLTLILAIISIHEIGHVLFGSFVGCRGKAVVFEFGKDSPYSELVCPASINYGIAYLGGFLTTIAFSLIYLANDSQRHLFFILLGFSLLFSASDFYLISRLELSFYLALFSGFTIVILGEYSLALNYIRSEYLFNRVK